MRRFLVGVLAFSLSFTMPGMTVMAQDNQNVELLVAQNDAGQDIEDYVVETEEMIELPPEYATAVTDATGTYMYTVNEDGTVTITDYLDETKNVNLVIPRKLDGYTVSAIGKSAFYLNSTIDSVTIPETIKSIGSYAFYYCDNITQLTLNEGLVSIGESAFLECDSIVTINIPSSVTSIGEGAFATGYSDLTTITMTAGNSNYKIKNNTLFTADEKTILSYWGKEESYVIPSTVERIGKYAFYHNKNLVNLTISDKVQVIGYGAFIYNIMLYNLVIPDNVVAIEGWAFQGCSAMKKLHIGKGVTTIGRASFNVSSIDEVIIPSNVKTIEGSAFMAADIKKLTIEEGLEEIGDDAFSCNDFEIITLPASLEKVGSAALCSCVNLKEIKVADGNKNYKIVDTALLTMNGKTILAYPIGNGVERYEIPYGVTYIESDTFTNCKLKRIEMPKTLTYIDTFVFSDCVALEEVVVGGSVTKIREYAFAYCANLKSVYIPSSVKLIRHGVFNDCNSLENIYYVGSKEQWDQIEIDMEQNSPLKDVTMYYMSNLRMFVERMYWDALGRAFDDYGLNAWVQMLVAGTHDGAGLAKEFILGQEFAMRNLSNEEYVDVLYETFFDRAADETGKMLWLGELAVGKSRAYVLSKFVNLPEFTALCAEYDILRGVMFEDGNVATPGCVQFVGRLYDLVMGREADNDGLYTWTFVLTYGVANAQGVATQFFNSAEYAAANKSNEAYVTDLYGVFMDRTPDESGLAFWVSCLSEQGVSRDWVLSEFAKSEEFKIIAARYGIQ